MVETRSAPRHRVMKPARIEYGGEKYPCTLRDLSITGAQLQLHDGMQTPDYFILRVPEDELELACRVVWRSGFKLGLAFE